MTGHWACSIVRSSSINHEWGQNHYTCQATQTGRLIRLPSVTKPKGQSRLSTSISTDQRTHTNTVHWPGSTGCCELLQWQPARINCNHQEDEEDQEDAYAQIITQLICWLAENLMFVNGVDKKIQSEFTEQTSFLKGRLYKQSCRIRLYEILQV